MHAMHKIVSLLNIKCANLKFFYESLYFKNSFSSMLGFFSKGYTPTTRFSTFMQYSEKSLIRVKPKQIYF